MSTHSLYRSPAACWAAERISSFLPVESVRVTLCPLRYTWPQSNLTAPRICIQVFLMFIRIGIGFHAGAEAPPHDCLFRGLGHFLKWFLLQCSSNRRANSLSFYNISRLLGLHEIANQRLVTLSVMFAMREERKKRGGKQHRYLTPANGNCHSLITNLEEVEQNKH